MLIRHTVNNDFHRGETIFEVLSGLEVPNLNQVPKSQTNGVHQHTNGITNGATNGATNGVEASA